MYKFDTDPPSPKHKPPQNFYYVVTHLTHPKEHFAKVFVLYPADHDNRCNELDPNRYPVSPSPHGTQLSFPHLEKTPSELTPTFTTLSPRQVQTHHDGYRERPENPIFICKIHPASSVGDLSPYSVTFFWPKQEWDFFNDFELSRDVNIDLRERSLFEVIIVPREGLKVAAAESSFPIDERHPTSRTVAAQFFKQIWNLTVGHGALDPGGFLAHLEDDSLCNRSAVARVYIFLRIYSLLS